MSERKTVIDSLVILVDATGVDIAVAALDRLTEAAGRAHAALQKLGATPVTVARVGETEMMRIGDIGK